MHRTIGYLSKRFVQIRSGEGRKVFLTALYFFLIITAYYVIKPVSRSLVLGELGSRMVPYVDLLSAILMGPFVTLFARLVDRMRKPQLLSLSFITVIAVLVLFWRLLAWPVPWIAGAFALWVSIFSVLVVTLFWLVANDLYRPREAKRLFGLIGSGGILGGIVGSSIAAVGAQVIGTEHLLLLSAGILLVCWWVVQQLWRCAPEPIAHEEAARARRHETLFADLRGFIKLLLQSRYLLLLVALVGLNKLVATLIYYQFNPFLEQAFQDVNARTTFTGIFFGGLNVMAFIMQFFFTSWILRRWGLGIALLALPLGALAGTTGLLIMPMFWLAASTELYDGSLNYSLQQTTKEVLYLPIDRSIRYKVKPFIDMVVFRFGKGSAAVLGILLLDVLGLPPRVLSCVAIPLLAAWLVVAVWLRRDYIGTIRTMLQARAAARRAQSPSVPSPASDEPGGSWSGELIEPGILVDGQGIARKLAMLNRLVEGPNGASSHTTALIAELSAYETPLVNPAALPADAARLKETISDQRESMATRRLAIQRVARSASQETVDYLFGMVMVEGDALLRREAVVALLKLRLHGGRLDFPTAMICRQVSAEVANYQRIVQVAAVYRQHHHGPLQADDPVIALLRLLIEDSIAQVFRLLMLLYRPEDIHLVYEQMRVPDAYVRSDAIELLDNLVDSQMRAILFPVMDEDRFLAALEETGMTPEPTAAYRILQEAIWDHNCWLSVTTLCAVGRLRLTTMRQEVEQASRHHASLVSAAGRVALSLSEDLR